MVYCALPVPAAVAATTAPVWHDGLDWHGEHVSVSRDDNGGYVVAWPFGQRTIAPQQYRLDSASVLVNSLYAMAQADLKEDSVTAIRDGAFDHGKPIPCHCFETGLKWPYVWTRDLSYSVDLGLWRFDSARSRNGLRFKLSNVREHSAPQGWYPMQDTGSGGSWPISADRVVWFLGARHLLDDKAFAEQVWPALRDTLAQDRLYAFDARFGLYRGETSFMDWREQSYPAWTSGNVVFIAQSYALSTNVLHYEALRLAERLAGEDRDRRLSHRYGSQAEALKRAINEHFWRADRGMYMSYIGGDGSRYDTYDLLGISLAVTSGIADEQRARQTLSNYPTWPAGTPVMWPERSDQAVYHNRAIWPFVSAYALRAARKIGDPARIEHEIRSVIRGAALYGSNLENYELLTQGQHVDLGKLSGPVVNSPRQLWSVAAMFDVIEEGIFGLTGNGRIEPKLPVSLVPTLFGKNDSISLNLPGRRIVLIKPTNLDGNLLVTGHVETSGQETRVNLKAIRAKQSPLRLDAPLFAPVAPPAPKVLADGKQWHVRVEGKVQLYINGHRGPEIDGKGYLPKQSELTCISATRVDANGLESLHSPQSCVGDTWSVGGKWPRNWTAPANGEYRLWLEYRNAHGPINTGITAAVKMLAVACSGSEPYEAPVVMPHSIGMQASTYVLFHAHAGAGCRFTLNDGFNMSYLSHFAHYTGGAGGAEGPLNSADIDALRVARMAGP